MSVTGEGRDVHAFVCMRGWVGVKYVATASAWKV